MIALIGRTGADQSALLYLLGGLHRPDSGRVSIEDHDLARLRANKLGYMLQSAELLPNHNILANVAVPLWEIGVPKEEIPRVARNALRLVGMENRMQHAPRQLSAKERQVAAVARAVVNDPAVIFAEEPTRGLDSSGREEMMGLFQRLNDTGKTIVIATSDSGLGAFCRRVVRMAEGRVVDDELVARRRVIPPSKRAALVQSETKEDEVLCPRCNFGNARGEATCRRCNTSLGGRESSGGPAGARRRLGEAALQAIVEELSKVRFLERLGSMGLAKLAPDLEPQEHPKGSRITKRGDPADSFYIIRRGEVQVVMEADDGAISPIADIGPNEGFGETEILTNQRHRTFTIVAATNVDLWRLARRAFETLLGEYPSLSRYSKQLLDQRLKMFQERVHSSAPGEGLGQGDDGAGRTAPPVLESAAPPR